MSLPSFDPKDLREHADPARVARIWARLEAELPGEAAGAERPVHATLEPGFLASSASRARSRTGLLLLAASLGAFAVGVVVGRGDTVRLPASPVATPTNETADAVLAAGSRTRSFSLPGGGAVTLAPGGTIEVGKVDGGMVTLRLVQGEAAFETAGATGAVAIEVGDARVSTIGATSLSVRRGSGAIDVAVADGLVEVEGPDGRRTLRRGEKATASTVTPIAIVTSAEPPRPEPLRRDPSQRNPAEAPGLLIADHASPSAADAPSPLPSTPGWFSLYDTARYDEALTAVEATGGLASMIDQGRTARELMALDHLARKKGQTILAMRALTRVATEFPEDPNAQAAAMTLGNLHRRAGNEAIAAQYYELAKNSAFGEDIACRRLASLDAGSPGAATAANDYLTKYPEGRCRVSAEDLLGDAREVEEDAADQAPAQPPAEAPVAPAGDPTEAPSAPAEGPTPPSAPPGSPGSAPAPK